MGARGWRATTFQLAGIDTPRASDRALSDFGPRKRGPAGRANQVALGRFVYRRSATAGFTRVEGAPVLVWLELARFDVKTNQGDVLKMLPVLHIVAAFSPSWSWCQGETRLSQRAPSRCGSAHNTRRHPSASLRRTPERSASARKRRCAQSKGACAPFVSRSALRRRSGALLRLRAAGTATAKLFSAAALRAGMVISPEVSRTTSKQFRTAYIRKGGQTRLGPGPCLRRFGITNRPLDGAGATR